MHSLWSVPELLIQIVLYLDEDDFITCHNVTHHWRQTLSRNLCPYQRPLPDPGYADHKPPPAHIPILATHTKSQIDEWASHPDIPFLEDAQFYWRESTFARVLTALKPCLHTFLARHACEFVDGLDALMEGKMGITIRTQCAIKEFVKLDASSRKRATLRRHDSANAGSPSLEVDVDALLTQPLVTSVEVSCMRGALWDTSNDGVLCREGPGRGLSCIRVERKKGVRLRDVLEEMRGVLMPVPQASVDGTMLLEWRFGDDAQ